MSNSNYQFTPTLDGLNNISGDNITCSEVICDKITATDITAKNKVTTKDLTLTGNILMSNTKKINWNNTSANSPYISYFDNPLYASLTIDAGYKPGVTSTQLGLVVSDVGGNKYTMDFMKDRLKIPTKLLMAENQDISFESGTGKIDQTNSTGTNILSTTTITGLLKAISNIQAFSGEVEIYLKNSPKDAYKLVANSDKSFQLFNNTIEILKINWTGTLHEIFIKKLITMEEGAFINKFLGLQDNKKIYWNNLNTGACIYYDESVKSLYLDSASVNGEVLLRTTGADGVRKVVSITGTAVNLEHNLIQSGTNTISQSGTGTNAMKAITLNADNNLSQSGTGTIRQSGTQENYLKDTNLTEVKAEKTLLGYETDEFINKDTALMRYYPFDTQLGTAYRFYNFNKYFVDGTYTASSMTNTGTQTNNNYVGQVGNSCFQFTNGRYFFNYGSSASYYDTNYMSFGGWVYVTTTATGCRPFFTQTTQSGSYLVLIGGNNTLTLNGDASGYFKGVTVLGSNANNAWWHIFVVIEGTTQKTYRNGTLIDTQTRTLFPTTGEATFGMGLEALSDSSRVDELRIYSRVLTADEVAAIYRYRGALREDWQTKMHGTTMVGDRIDASYPTRGFNVRSADGIISIGRYNSAQPGFELLNFDPDIPGVPRSTALFLGGGGTDYATMLLRTGGDVFVYWVYRDLFDITVALRVRGANVRIDGNITQPTSTTTNEMRGITMYADQNLTQSGTGIISQSGTGTNALKSTNITGTLGITGYSDVKATLDSFATTSTQVTGISYNAGTDTTTIDNNVDITKNLILQDDKVVLTSPTGYVMDECEKHTYLYSINRAIGAPYRTIRTTSFEAVDINADLTVAAGQYVFSLVKIIKGVTYSGAFMINSSVGTDGFTAQMALMEAGIGSAPKPLARLAITDGFTTAKSTLHYAAFRTPYIPTETIYAYVGYVITSLAALSPTLRGQSINYNNNYKITTCKTGSLTSLCCGYSAANGSSFDTMGTTLNPSQTMTAYGTQMYCGLYTDE